MKKLLFITLFITVSSSGLLSQTIMGVITDANNGTPLPDASIGVFQSQEGTHSDSRGFYSLRVTPGKQTLVVRFVGYVPEKKDFRIKEGETLTLDLQLVSDNIEQEQVVVTANKIGTNRNIIPMNISVVTQKTIEEGAESNILAAIDAHVPGIFITERGVAGFGLAGGSAGKISIRGVGGGETSFPVLILIDGQPQFMGIMGHAIPDSYLSSDVEKAEVVKGPASILYGTNAMGGAINLITKGQKEEGPSFRGSLTYGSFDTREYSASAGYRKQRFQARGSWNHTRTDGSRPNSAFSLNNGYVKLGYEISSHIIMDATLNHSFFEAADPGSVYANPADYDNESHWVDIKRTNFYFTLANKFEKTEGGIKAYNTWGDHDIYDGWKSQDHNSGLSIYQGLKLFPGNLLSLGVDLKKYGGKGISPSLGQMSNKMLTVSETGGYAIGQQTLTDRITLTGGIRYDHHSMYGGTWIPQVGAAYGPPGKSIWKALVSKGFRNPTIRELYLFPPANPALIPESMWNYELTWSRDFASHKGSAEITGFVARGNNLILTVPNPSPPPPLKNQNTGEFSHEGFEASVRYTFTQKFNLRGSYSYLHMDSPRVSSPVHQFFAAAGYNAGKFELTAHLQHIGKLYTLVVNGNDPLSESYTLLNSHAVYHLQRNVRLFLSAENILDQEYQVQYGYPMPGITLFTGIKISL